MKSIHFFKTGLHHATNGKVFSFSESDLQKLAAAYDPNVHEAPIVVGHPKNDLPAYGWIEKVEARPDGLHAIPRQLHPEFSEMVQSGAFKKVSAGLYHPRAPEKPKPDGYYLRHLGFLGAEPPAMKGLQPIHFSEKDETLCFAEEDVVSLREHSLHVREKAHRSRESEAAIRSILAEGRFPIAQLEGVLAFCESLDDDDAPLEFSEHGGAQVSMDKREWFLDFLRKQPIPVMLGEMATGVLFSEQDEKEFVVPEGYSVNRRSAAVARQTERLMKDKGLTFSEAHAAAEAAIPIDL